MDEETLDIILAAQAVGIDAIQDVARAVRELETRMLQLIVVTGGVIEATLANAAAQKVAKEATEENAEANKKAIPFITGLLSELDKAPFWVQAVAAALLVLLTVLEPFVVALLAATTILAGFTVGLAGLAAAVLLVVGPFVALGAAMVFLANKAFQQHTQELKDQVTQLGVQRDQLIAAGHWGAAQQALYTKEVAALKAEIGNLQDPLESFRNTIGEIVQVMGTAALPVLSQLGKAFQDLAPGIEHAGLQAIAWFQQRLPAALAGTQAALGPLGHAVTQITTDWGHFFDQMIQRFPQIGPVAQTGLDLVVSTLKGLETNLIRLSDWFLKELPTMGPVVGQIFSWIGQHMQDILSAAARLVNFFIDNWPEITKNAKNTWDAIVKGWNDAAPILLTLFPMAIQLVGLSMAFMHDHGDLLMKMLEALITVLELTIITLSLLLAIISAVTAAVSAVYEWFQRLFGFLNGLADMVSAPIGAIDRVANAVWGLARAAGSALDLLLRIPIAAGMAAASAANAASWGQGSVSGGMGGNVGGPLLTFAGGGLVPGPVGAPQVAVVHGGEEVLTPEQRAAVGQGGVDVTLILDREVLGRFVDRRISAYQGRTRR